MMKVIHIHTDLKFISDTGRFEGKYFENLIVIVNNSRECNALYRNKYIWFNNSVKSIHKIVELCKDTDLVVLYELNSIKCKIALALPSSVRIAWRFFGCELYGKESQFSSTLTQKARLLDKKQMMEKVLKIMISSIKSHLKPGFNSNTYFIDAIKRIDFFLCFSQEEYNFLSARWNYLPFFIKLPISKLNIPIKEFYIKKKLIIIGNNRSRYNNNLDIIEIIEASENRNQFQFVLFFNYGNESNYSHKVRDAVKGKNYYRVINDFMPVDKFYELYQEASAAVFNGYRQMALGNIFTALKYGVKLYLNDKNIVKQWLNNNGIIVHSVDNLSQDLKNGNITLSIEEVRRNAEQFQKLINSYTHDDFQRIFYSLIRNKITC